MTTLVTQKKSRRTRRSRNQPVPVRSVARGVSWVFAAEIVSSVIGFLALVHQARRLGPLGFSNLEYGAVVAGWLLVLVRGGVDSIVYREAARHPRLIGPLTELLIGLRLLVAVLGFAVAVLIAVLVGPGRGPAVLVAGLVLFPACWVADVGPRATNRLGWVALAQVVRALGLLFSVLMLVRRPTDVLPAATCLVFAEALGALVPLSVHMSEFRRLRVRLRRRASVVLAKRGAIAGLGRFLRVTIYAADLLMLGWFAGGSELGNYAAGRRLVFAIVALGLVIPATLAPTIARAWHEGSDAARRRIGEVFAWLWTLSLPAAVGIGLTANRWMPLLFGASYQDGGPWLALIAARLPWLLAAACAQTALLACRRERDSLHLVLGQFVMCCVVYPVGWYLAGAWGVGWSAFAVEMTGAIAGWLLLAQLGVAPSWRDQVSRALVGSLMLCLACKLSREAPLIQVCFKGAIAYGFAWWYASRLMPRVELS